MKIALILICLCINLSADEMIDEFYLLLKAKSKSFDIVKYDKWIFLQSKKESKIYPNIGRSQDFNSETAVGGVVKKIEIQIMISSYITPEIYQSMVEFEKNTNDELDKKRKLNDSFKYLPYFILKKPEFYNKTKDFSIYIHDNVNFNCEVLDKDLKKEIDDIRKILSYTLIPYEEKKETDSDYDR